MKSLLYASESTDHTAGIAAFARPETRTLVVRTAPDSLIPARVDPTELAPEDFSMLAEEYVHRATGQAPPQLNSYAVHLHRSGEVIGMRLGNRNNGVEINRLDPARGWQPLSAAEAAYFAAIEDPRAEALTTFADAVSKLGDDRLTAGALLVDPDVLEAEVLSPSVVNALAATPTPLRPYQAGGHLPVGQPFQAGPPPGPGSLLAHWRPGSGQPGQHGRPGRSR